MDVLSCIMVVGLLVSGLLMIMTAYMLRRKWSKR